MKKKWGLSILVGVLFVLLVSLTAMAVIREAYRKGSLRVCQLIGEHYHRREESAVQEFLKNCALDVRAESFFLARDEIIARINRRLEALGTSHLSFYSPSENREIWENTSRDTGIRSRLVDAYLVVHNVLAKSPAARAGVRPGDVLEGLNGRWITTPHQAQTGSGVFTIMRRSQKIEQRVEAEELQEDLSPLLTDLGNGGAILKIPSFLPRYFDHAFWRSLSRQFPRIKQMVIDVRGNSGGSFPAMLRALSPFRCEHPLIGSLYQPLRKDLRSDADLENRLDAESQLELLEKFRRVNLRTFMDYGCFNGPVTVLIDSDTSSVAEIFAQAFFSRPRSRIWGQPSAGRVVMARWFSVPEFGSEEFAVSIPIAGYQTSDGLDLESQGIYPQHVLHYDVGRALEGRDSWLEEAVRTSWNVSK